MLGLRLHHSAEAVQKVLYQNGLIVNCTATDVLRIVPPFVITKTQIQDGLRILRKTLAAFPATAPKTDTPVTGKPVTDKPGSNQKEKS
jgi:acetylornithine/succinyldiaminopimelate/putrescine aminotransferase